MASFSNSSSPFFGGIGKDTILKKIDVSVVIPDDVKQPEGEQLRQKSVSYDHSKSYTVIMVAIPDMSKAGLLEWLRHLLGESNEEEAAERTARTFDPSKDLIEKDHLLIDMLNSPGHEDVFYCICDPDKDDCPIIFSSDGFCSFTGYSHEEIEGRNCRFLQVSNSDVSFAE